MAEATVGIIVLALWLIVASLVMGLMGLALGAVRGWLRATAVSPPWEPRRDGEGEER